MENNELVLKLEQSIMIQAALRKAGYPPELAHKLGNAKTMAKILPFLKGEAEIRLIHHIIDCDKEPELFRDWSILSHKKHGKFSFSIEKITLYLPKGQRTNNCAQARKIYEEVYNLPVLNVNVLYCLLNHKYLIPEEWKGMDIFFWGTIFRANKTGEDFVFYLFWNGEKWEIDYYCLNNPLSGSFTLLFAD